MTAAVQTDERYDDGYAAEEWRDIAGHEGRYQVSSLGRLRSLDRVVVGVDGRCHRFTGKVITGGPAGWYSNGKLKYQSIRFENRTYSVHSLVAVAFHGPRRKGHEVRHLDGNHFNNSAANLAWGTGADQYADKVRHGRCHMRRRTHCPYGHSLTAPNLTSQKAKRGQRNCLACSRARAAVFKAKGRGILLNHQSVSDHRYAVIMESEA